MQAQICQSFLGRKVVEKNVYKKKNPERITGLDGYLIIK